MVRDRAAVFLESLREGRWKEASEFVLLDEVTRSRIGIAQDDSQEVIREKIGQWFKGIYGSVKPGQVVSVRLDPKDPQLAHITYRHGDLDGFDMRFAGGNWYYTLDWQPHPEDAQSLTFSQPLYSPDCSIWHDAIEQAFENENHCETDSDCRAIQLGGPYVEFGCFKYVNKTVSQEGVYQELDSYRQKCTVPIDKCAPAPTPVCVSNRCTALKN